MPLGRELSIGQVAARTGLAVSAIRYYEEEGLLSSERNASGHRRFARATIRRLSFVMVAQRFGFSIKRIRALMGTLPDRRTPNEHDWQRFSGEFRADLDAQIATLVALRDTLDGCIGCGCLSLKKCGLYNPDDVAANYGAGARYLMGDSAPPVSNDAGEHAGEQAGDQSGQGERRD